MSMTTRRYLTTLGGWLLIGAWGLVAHAQPHEHHEHGDKPVEPPPKIFLDKSPRVIQYQLDRLSNQRLLMVERATDDAKYAPVYRAILVRAGMATQDREEALQALVAIQETDPVTELIAALQALPVKDVQQRTVGYQLASLLLKTSPDKLTEMTEALRAATQAEHDLLRAVGYAGLIGAGLGETTWNGVAPNPQAMLDFLAAIPLVPQAKLRGNLRPAVIASLDPAKPVEVRRAALMAIASIPIGGEDNFRLVARSVTDDDLRTTAVRTLLKTPRDQRPAETARQVVEQLVSYAEATPADQRTTDGFVDAMQLADELLAIVPATEARTYRARLREVTVRVIRIHTVEEEMRYDTRYFAVEAGRPVQLVLQNEDLMPHNLVITVPGALREIAEAGAFLPQGTGGKPYVPDSEQVLFATGLVPARQTERLTFTAPSVIGEYPYVCTFPRHWMRMYGVMIVVEDLDAWLQDPQEPSDPTGNNRSFVQSWTMEDLAAHEDEIVTNLRGRTPEIGARIFKEATCAQCHKVSGQGGAVGPELTDVYQRWKGDHVGVLREIIDPSHKVDPKFAMQTIVTESGQIISGIVQTEDQDSVTVIVNPEAPEPTVIRRADIDEIVKSSKSMMPKALLDRFTKDEIFELLNFLHTVAPAGE